jgi:hypothetical protein
MNLALAAMPRWKFVRRMFDKHQSKAIKFANLRHDPRSPRLRIASKVGFKCRIFTGERSCMLAVLPAIGVDFAEGRFTKRGLVPPTDHVDFAN